MLLCYNRSLAVEEVEVSYFMIMNDNLIYEDYMLLIYFTLMFGFSEMLTKAKSKIIHLSRNLKSALGPNL